AHRDSAPGHRRRHAKAALPLHRRRPGRQLGRHRGHVRRARRTADGRPARRYCAGRRRARPLGRGVDDRRALTNHRHQRGVRPDAQPHASRHTQKGFLMHRALTLIVVLCSLVGAVCAGAWAGAAPNAMMPARRANGTVAVGITQPTSGTTVYGGAWAVVVINGARGAANNVTLTLGGHTVGSTTSIGVGAIALPYDSTLS